jgi:FkbM family methyltransferase
VPTTVATGARRRLEEPVRAVARRLARAVPPSRRVKGLGGARGRRRLQLRKLVAPLFQVPVTLTTGTGLHLRITADPVDEQIAQHVLGPQRSSYFPPWPVPEPRAPCILDVGAHHGLYAAAALHEYPSSRIICVEPSRDAIVALRTNLALNDSLGRARVVQAALAPTSGEGVLLQTAEGTWGASLYEDASDATGSETVPLATLHEVLGDDRPDIVKCNAEGAEYTLIDELARTDVRPVFMVVMVHPEFGDVDGLVAGSEAMGYELTRIGTETRPAFQMWRRPR